MPELPEVETMRRGILAAQGCQIVRAVRTGCRKKPMAMNPAWPSISRRVKGKCISHLGRHGKRLIIHLDSGDAIVIEPRMTGLILIEEPPTKEHLRFELQLTGGDCDRVCYWDQRGLGHLHLLNESQFAEYFDSRRIGPDALEISVAQLREGLAGRRIGVKVGLLDQKAVAGIGNIYASEILHLAGVDPRQACCNVRRDRWPVIHKKMLDVLQTAIDQEGSTLSDGTYRNALNDPGGYQNQHRVYDRAGHKCPTCQRGTIRRIVQAQRSTYYCSACQRKRQRG